jgi:DNA-binding MarR family transcriptional regulator
MINIHTELMDLVQQKVINTDEFFVLLCITKRIGKKRQSFPSRSLLMKETNLSKDKISRSVTNLVKAGILIKEQRNNGKFSSNLYTLKTKLLGVYIGVEDEILEEDSVTQNTDTENACPQNKPLSIDQSCEVLINSLNIKKGESKTTITGNVEIKNQRSNPITRKQKEKKFNAEIYVQNIIELDSEVKQTLLDLIEIRKCKKVATTQKAIDLIIKDLNKWYPDNPKKQIEALENSIKGGWSGVFEIKTQNNNYSKNNYSNQKPKSESENDKTIYKSIILGANQDFGDNIPF